MEVFVSHAAVTGVPMPVLQEMMEAVTTDEVIRILTEHGSLESTMESILKKIDFHINGRCYGELPIGAVLFSNEHGILGMTEEAKRLVKIPR